MRACLVPVLVLLCSAAFPRGEALGFRNAVTVSYTLYTGGPNVINIPMYKDKDGTKFKASDIAPLVNAGMMARKNPDTALGVLPYIKEFANDFDIEPDQAYFIIVPFPVPLTLSGFGPDTEISGQNVSEPRPTLARAGLNPIGFPVGVPHQMTLEDLRLWPNRYVQRPFLFLFTTERAVDQLLNFTFYARGWLNRPINVGQGVFGFLTAKLDYPGLRLPGEGTSGFGWTVSTVGRASIAAGRPTEDKTPANNTPMSDPVGVRSLNAADPRLVAYADRENNAVRKTDPSTRPTSIVADVDRIAGRLDGSNTCVESTIAKETCLLEPYDVEYNAETAEFFIADTGHAKIWRVKKSGSIEKAAGGGLPSVSMNGDGNPPNQASLIRPTGLALRGGYLYVADEGLPRIRRFPANGTGVIEHFAGGSTTAPFLNQEGLLAATEASFARTQKLAATADGIYVTDSMNGNVRFVKIPATGAPTITTVAGSLHQDGTLQNQGSGYGPTRTGFVANETNFKDLWGVSVDQDKMVYVSDISQANIYRVGTRQNRVALIAGGGASVEPIDGTTPAVGHQAGSQGVHTLQGPLLHFADWQNNRIRRIVQRPQPKPEDP